MLLFVLMPLFEIVTMASLLQAYIKIYQGDELPEPKSMLQVMQF